VFSILLILPAAAAARTDSPSARSLALGDAVRAIGMGADSLYFNPGTLAQINQYSVNFGYGYAHWSQWHQASASFVDSQTNKWISGGIGYNFGYATNADKAQTHDIRIALGSKYANDKIFFGFGLTMRAMNVSADSEDSHWYLDMDFGAALGIMKVFYIGVVGQNLIQNAAKSGNVATVSPGTGRTTWNLSPRKLGVGIGVSYSIFNIGLDCDVDFSSIEGKATPSLMAGFEVIAKQVVAIRAGVNWDRVGHFDVDSRDMVPEMRLSLGVGYVSKAVGVDVSYAHDVWDKSGFYLQTTIRVFLP
jgi:hypothetical protein